MTATLLLTAVLATARIPCCVCCVDVVDRVEVNHVYSRDDGRHIGDYTLFWDWNPYRCDWVVMDWRHLKDTGRWEETEHWSTLIWREGNQLRVVRTQNTLETWTLYDREVEDRQLWPTERWRRLKP